MFKLKLQFKFGKSWDILKQGSTWDRVRNLLLERVSYGLMKNISDIASDSWKNPTGKSDFSWYNRVNKAAGTATIGNTQSYLYWQNKGVVSHQMRYLLNVGEKMFLAFGKYPYWGKKFIPIMTDDGLIFRRCTEKSIKAGGWWHPGFKGKQFVQKGVERFKRNELQNEFNDVIVRGGLVE